MQIKNKIIFSLILIFILSLAGCSQETQMDDLQRYVAGLKKMLTKQKKKDFISTISFPVSVVFQANGKERDPFEDEVASYNNKESTTTPLTSFPTRLFEFIGTISRDNQIWAIVKAPDDKVYQVTINDRMGDHYGRILKIYPHFIEIEEEVSAEESGSGGQGVTKRMVTLQLKGVTE